MNWYERLIIFVVLFVGVWIVGCSQVSFESWKPVCRHQAVYAALTVGEEYPTRILSGVNTKSGIRHAQAQAYIRDEWRWLAVINGYIVVEESMRPDFVPDHTYKPILYAARIKTTPLHR